MTDQDFDETVLQTRRGRRMLARNEPTERAAEHPADERTVVVERHDRPHEAMRASSPPRLAPTDGSANDATVPRLVPQPVPPPPTADGESLRPDDRTAVTSVERRDRRRSVAALAAIALSCVVSAGGFVLLIVVIFGS